MEMNYINIIYQVIISVSILYYVYRATTKMLLLSIAAGF